jgi:hypothetical protein
VRRHPLGELLKDEVIVNLVETWEREQTSDPSSKVIVALIEATEKVEDKCAIRDELLRSQREADMPPFGKSVTPTL